MTSDAFQERTEPPTKRRLLEARQQGTVARSRDLVTAGQLLIASLVAFVAGAGFVKSILEFLQRALSQPARLNIAADQIVAEFRQLSDWSAAHVLPFLLVCAGCVVFLNLIQIGFLFAPSAIQPSWPRVHPVSGLRRILSQSSLFGFAVAAAKLIVCLTVVSWFLLQQLSSLVILPEFGTADIAERVGKVLLRFAFVLSLAYLVLALFDIIFQKWRYKQELRMTKEEVRAELKNMDGDPRIQQRRREVHQKLSQAHQVPKKGLMG